MIFDIALVYVDENFLSYVFLGALLKLDIPRKFECIDT